MSRYDSDHSVSPVYDSRSHGYGPSMSPLAASDRRTSQHAFGDGHSRYAFLPDDRDESLPQTRGVDAWVYPMSEQGLHPLAMDTLWTRPAASPPTTSTNRSNLPPNSAQAGASSAGPSSSSGNNIVTQTRVAPSSSTPTVPSSASFSTTTNNAQRSLFNPVGGTIPSPLVFAQSNASNSNPSALYSFSADLSRELEPLLHLPPTGVVPIAPVSLSNSLPQQSADASYGGTQPQSPTNSKSPSRSTLWWGELEPWMDEEYAKQVCGLMGWDSVTVKIPHTPADPVTGQQANNPGYCFLTFPTAQHAATVLSQINNPTSDAQVTMPNSTKPFVLNWASSPSPSPATTSFNVPPGLPSAGVGQAHKEYSIFVGDLAPETSNSDLVAVFRNPVLGLRNDRAPKFIRPFYSCKSAKIMLDPVTGISRGYGFVRFTEEADQQRALIEMHGLYCLSRPSAFYFHPRVKNSLLTSLLSFPSANLARNSKV